MDTHIWIYALIYIWKSMCLQKDKQNKTTPDALQERTRIWVLSPSTYLLHSCFSELLPGSRQHVHKHNLQNMLETPVGRCRGKSTNHVTGHIGLAQGRCSCIGPPNSTVPMQAADWVRPQGRVLWQHRPAMGSSLVCPRSEHRFTWAVATQVSWAYQPFTRSAYAPLLIEVFEVQQESQEKSQEDIHHTFNFRLSLHENIQFPLIWSRYGPELLAKYMAPISMSGTLLY